MFPIVDAGNSPVLHCLPRSRYCKFVNWASAWCGTVPRNQFLSTKSCVSTGDMFPIVDAGKSPVNSFEDSTRYLSEKVRDDQNGEAEG